MTVDCFPLIEEQVRFIVSLPCYTDQLAEFLVPALFLRSHPWSLHQPLCSAAYCDARIIHVQ